LLTCGHQIWILRVPHMDATNPWNLTYFSRSEGSKWTNQILGKKGGTNRNRCT